MNVVFAIGCKRYRDPDVARLQYADRDARRFVETVMGTQDTDNTEDYLLHDEHENEGFRPTRANILYFLSRGERRDKSKELDFLFFYFSGHGWSSQDGTDYLLTSDSLVAMPKDTAISVPMLVGHLRKWEAKYVVLFVDACRAVMTGGKSTPIPEEARINVGSLHIPGMVTFSSCAPGQISYESDDIQSGVFTEGVCRALSNEGRCSSIQELDKYLNDRVPKISDTYGLPRQIPYSRVEPLEVQNALIVSPRIREAWQIKERLGDAAKQIEREVMANTVETIYESEEENTADFEALRRLEGSDHKFSHAELEELRPLLGLYGRKIEKRLPPGKAEAGYVIQRMLHWKQKKDQTAARSVERTVAERAYTRYGTIYGELVARKSLSIGIDFGTANSSMAWCVPETGLAEIIRNEEGEEKTPSVVYFGKNEFIVGKYAEELLEEVEDSTDPEERNAVAQRIVRGIKRNLLSPPIIPIPGRKAVRPLDVVAHILGKLKHDAEQEHFNEEVERLVVTCPATFDVQRRQVLRDAAVMAGFRRVELLDESTAVALALTKQGQDLGKGMIVYDLGAQMFKLSVVARESEDSPYQVLKEPQRDPDFGADDLDLALYYYCDAIAMKELGRHISLKDEPDPAFLRQCRRRKENLSTSATTIFSSYLSSQNGPQRFRHTVHREAFEDLIQPQIEGTVTMAVKLWEQVKDQVDAVVLIGGASRIPLVRQRLEKALPLKVRSLVWTDHAVAQGAAYKAYELSIEEARHHH